MGAETPIPASARKINEYDFTPEAASIRRKQLTSQIRNTIFPYPLDVSRMIQSGLLGRERLERLRLDPEITGSEIKTEHVALFTISADLKDQGFSDEGSIIFDPLSRTPDEINAPVPGHHTIEKSAAVTIERIERNIRKLSKEVTAFREEHQTGKRKIC